MTKFIVFLKRIGDQSQCFTTTVEFRYKWTENPSAKLLYEKNWSFQVSCFIHNLVHLISENLHPSSRSTKSLWGYWYIVSGEKTSIMN